MRLVLSPMKDQQVVEAFLPHTSQETFTNGICSGGAMRKLEKLYAPPCVPARHTWSKVAGVITNQVLWRLPVRGSFSQRYAPPRHLSESVSRLCGSPSVTSAR